MIISENLTKTYGHGPNAVHALDDVSLHVEAGTYAAITGPSGCGKSTLLHLLGALDLPTSGQLTVGGLSLHDADERQRTRYRREVAGLIFQFFQLLPQLSVWENVLLPAQLAGKKGSELTAHATKLLELVGMEHRRKHLTTELSGGEMQRTAIARALVLHPKLLLADEPTGNLDSQNEERILDLFDAIHQSKLTTLVVVTHSKRVAGRAERQILLKDGRLV